MSIPLSKLLITHLLRNLIHPLLCISRTTSADNIYSIPAPRPSICLHSVLQLVINTNNLSSLIYLLFPTAIRCHFNILWMSLPLPATKLPKDHPILLLLLLIPQHPQCATPSEARLRQGQPLVINITQHRTPDNNRSNWHLWQRLIRFGPFSLPSPVVPSQPNAYIIRLPIKFIPPFKCISVNPWGLSAMNRDRTGQPVHFAWCGRARLYYTAPVNSNAAFPM